MKKKIILILIMLGLAALLFTGCQIDSEPNPEFRFITAGGIYYCALGTQAGTNTYSFDSAWVYSDGTSASDYTSVPEGTYYILFDGDISHDSFAYASNNPYFFEKGKTYTITWLDPSGTTFNIEED